MCVPSSRPATRFLDILDNIRLIQGYLQGMDRAAFEADSRTRDAVERCLERLSEAATKLGSQAEKLAPGQPWPAVRAFGNVLRHAYDQVDPARIWEIATGAEVCRREGQLADVKELIVAGDGRSMASVSANACRNRAECTSGRKDHFKIGSVAIL